MTASLAMSMPEYSLIFFLAFFVIVLARVFGTRKERWQQHAQIPLDDLNDGGSDRVH